jgi:glycosyltransferase involved in cell wall biosynthesis
MFAEIEAENYRGMSIFRPAGRRPRRKVFYLNSYGMASAWRQVQQGTYPGQHLWGCLELVRMGYEVAMPEEPDVNRPFFNYRRQDLRHVRFARQWLGREGILYSAHTILFWSPLLASAGVLRCPVVTLLYARGENLRFAAGYRGVIAMTPAAQERAQALADQARVAHLSWGVDLPFFPLLPYAPQWFLSCGKTRRDFSCLREAAARRASTIRVINGGWSPGPGWPANVELITDRQQGDWKAATFQELIHEHYAGCAAALIVLLDDPNERFAAGFTQLLEAMALGRPVIVTRTGAITGELDVEKEGCGLAVSPNDPDALARAMQTIAEDPARAAAMGQAGRRLCSTRYNIERYAHDLHEFFESL